MPVLFAPKTLDPAGSPAEAPKGQFLINTLIVADRKVSRQQPTTMRKLLDGGFVEGAPGAFCVEVEDEHIRLSVCICHDDLVGVRVWRDAHQCFLFCFC